MNYLVISSSLSPSSRSRLLARSAYERLERAGERDDTVEWVDLADLRVPMCDGDSAWDHPDATALQSAVASADGIIVGLGIYNYSASAAAKTLAEIGGKAWSGKIVGFACAAGGHSSYMAILSLANALMLDFRSIIVPRFVYAAGDVFDQDRIVDESVQRRLEELADELRRMTSALRGASCPVPGGSA